jgi:hypothetical protein
MIKEGSIHVTPVWLDFGKGYIIVNTIQGRLKHRKVSRDGHVTISVADHVNPYKMVTVRLDNNYSAS